MKPVRFHPDADTEMLDALFGMKISSAILASVF
jgi:hypothetical protein